MSSLPLQPRKCLIFLDFPMKNVVKIFGIPMSSLGGVHLISGIAPYIAEMCILLNSILDEWLEFTFRPVLHYKNGCDITAYSK